MASSHREDLAPPEPHRGADPEEPPPILGKWSRLYLVLVGALLAQVLLYAWLTRWAS
jgi:hypothetical protein